MKLHLGPPRGKILEIGAFDQPTFVPGKADARYLDRFSLQELRDKHGENPRRIVDRAVEPDYVIKEKRFANRVKERFDLVVANHVVEHVPDMLTWLHEIEQLTIPGGHLFLAVPDRRYTFDFLRRETTTTDLLQSLEDDLESPSTYQIFDSLYFYRPVRQEHAWSGQLQDLLAKRRFGVSEAWERAKRHAADGQADVHCNVYSFQTFATLWADIQELALVKWNLVAQEDVPRGSNEFLLLLEKPLS